MVATLKNRTRAEYQYISSCN